ncbi:hypothetical protein HQ945_05235 [Phyllobacterium sp. BT25]|uniref:Uncharacterized protein n=1 Tax=Phyllobacterium pellucidum TaxID=2740464 RepID=A0A849VLG6_9HYPH|nr:hypothetical protein [Phyllobacterium pellucidum]NTS30651.1 hypothetical protein [Phyllobacterium pellucidum]
MDGSNRPVIEDIYDDLVAVHVKAGKECFGLLAYLINEAIEEAKSIREEETAKAPHHPEGQ